MFTELAEANRLAGDLRVQFNQASDASNRAVMADTDEASVAFAREAEQKKALIASDVLALGPLLHSLGHAAEIKSLDDFESRFASYEKVDRSLLALAVENTNLKAQRLSFGAAREAADGFRDVLGAVVKSATAKDHCRVESLAAKAVIAVREIQVLQAPHIAESDDAVMTRLEREMAALQSAARGALTTLQGLAGPTARSQLAQAATALDHFQQVSTEIVTLSRRNSNVRSLELALRGKPTLAGACDESLRALQDALAKEDFTATR